MKLFIATLILLNGVVFGLYHFELLEQSSPQQQVLPVVTSSAEQLKLLNESADQERDQPPASPISLDCYLLEQVAEDVAEPLMTRLTQETFDYKQERFEFDEISSYWVHVPSLPTFSDARAVNRRVRALGVKDVYVIEAGHNKNAVSLGLYSDKRAAEKRVAWFKTKGIVVELAERYKQSAVYRVEVEAQTGEQSDLLEALFAKEFESVNYQKNTCK